MSRVVALLLAILLFGLAIVVGATHQREDLGSIDLQTLIYHSIAMLLLGVGLLFYCGFAALHSTQYVTSPQERTIWLIATVGVNVVGSCLYYLTAYQAFRKAGKGRLMRFSKSSKD